MTWLSNHGTYLAGQEAIDTLDLLAIEMERKWGSDRLRLLVTEELRHKFDRQRWKTNQAIWTGELADVQRETKRMQNAWKVLDRYAEIHASPLNPAVWEVSLEDGSVAQIVQDSSVAGLQAAANARLGRKAAVYTLEEVGRLLSKFPSLWQAKEIFPGSTVTKVRQSVSDPLNSIDDRSPVNP